MKYKLFLWINQSNGDTLGMIPLIEAIKKQYPETDIIFGCYHDHAYLLEHLPIKILPVYGDYKNMAFRTIPNYFIDKIKDQIPSDFISIHLGGGHYGHKHTWQDQVKTFNNQFKENDVDMFIDDSDFGYIELPLLDFEVKDKSVYVENSHTVSGQTDFQFDLYKYSLMFPRLNFYTTGSVNFSAKNIFDCSKLNFIELSNISRKCSLILGKGSGPFFCTLNETNKNKIKCLAGLKSQWKYKFWNLDDENTILVDTEEEVINLLRLLSRDKTQ